MNWPLLVAGVVIGVFIALWYHQRKHSALLIEKLRAMYIMRGQVSAYIHRDAERHIRPEVTLESIKKLISDSHLDELSRTKNMGYNETPTKGQ